MRFIHSETAPTNLLRFQCVINSYAMADSENCNDNPKSIEITMRMNFMAWAIQFSNGKITLYNPSNLKYLSFRRGLSPRNLFLGELSPRISCNDILPYRATENGQNITLFSPDHLSAAEMV